MAIPPEDNSPKKPDASQEAFVREVDDAVRQDAATRFFSRFGKPLIAVVVAGLVGYAGWLWYGNSQQESAGALGGQLMAALENADANNGAAAKAAADKLASVENPAYRGAAMLVQGNVALGNGDVKAATGAFAKLALDGKAPDDLRQLATIRQTLAEMDSIKPEMVITRMQPLLSGDGPWVPAAMELTAIAKMNLGKPADAQALYSKIANRKDVPPSLKARATQMASSLSGAKSASATVSPAAAPSPAEKSPEKSPEESPKEFKEPAK